MPEPAVKPASPGGAQKRRRNDDPVAKMKWKVRRAWGTFLYVALAVAVLAILTGWPGILGSCHR